ncbi:MAG TPA: M81 family metallopeptidase, partial [Chryseolinea sp.]|nr:M81 family metallopeptidase [Chryseolinea sp.]
MYRLFVLYIIALLVVSCTKTEKPTASGGGAAPRIAIAGLAIESSTFSPATTNEEAFHARTGDSILTSYSFLAIDSPDYKRAQWFPALIGRSIPGGIVTKEAYESLLEKMLGGLKQNLPYDGLFFDIHGAMSVQGVDDPEGDMIRRIRKLVGYETLISTSMDLHGNVSHLLAQESDLITCYRMAPHEDAMQSRKRTVENLLSRLESGKGKPAFKAYVKVPILLPGEKTSTRVEPGKSLYARVGPASIKQGIVDAAIWIGYAWADEPRNHAVVVVTGDDELATRSTAEDLAKTFWSVRQQFKFIAPTAPLKEALDTAIASDKHPFMISDTGDNPTAGGAGDVTWTLQELLKRKEFQTEKGPSVIYASIPGPEFVDKAVAAGEGSQVDGVAGAAVDNRYAPPVRLQGIVKKIRQGDANAETEVVVQVGSIQVIVTRKRKPYHYVAD